MDRLGASAHGDDAVAGIRAEIGNGRRVAASGGVGRAGRRRSGWVLPTSVILVVWSLACWVPGADVGTWAGPVVSAAALTPFIGLLSVPLITVAVRRQYWVSAGLALFAGAFPWVFVLGYASPGRQVAPAGSQEVRLLLVNAHEGHASAQDVVAAAASHAADLVVVTELSIELAHDLTVAGLDNLLTPAYVVLPSVTGGAVEVREPADAGIGVWSKYPISNVQSVPGTQWPAVLGRVQAPGTGFVVLAGHVRPPLPDNGSRWAADLSALRAVSAAARRALPDTPQVLLANLNATPWNSDFRRFRQVGLIDATDSLGKGLRNTWPAWSPLPLLPLDHVLTSESIVVTTVDSVGLGGTDHRGLALTVKIPPPA